MDPLDDLFDDAPVKNARVVGKFQPKAKFRPHRKDSAPTSVQVTDTAKNVISKPLSDAKPSEHHDEQNSKATTSLHSNMDDVPRENEDLHASKTSIEENADIYIELGALSDFPPHTTTDMEGTIPASEAAILTSPDLESAQGEPVFPVLSSVEGSTHTCDVVNTPPRSRSEAGDCMDNIQMEREELDAMDSINISEFATKSARRTGKFKPKPKVQMQNEKRVARSVTDELGSHLAPSEISSVDLDSDPAFQQDDVLDLSSIGFPHSETIEATSEFPLNEESINLMKMPQFDSGLNVDAAPEFPAKLTSRRAKTGMRGVNKTSDPSLQACSSKTSDPSLQACSFSSENGTGRSLRPRKRKKSSCELVEAEDEVLTNREFSDEPPGRSAVVEENIINEESQVESEPKVKKVRQKSKKINNDTEKPDKKRKKAKEASDQVADAKPKKFSHSTKRRRVVDKVLLETPEDELDYRNVPLRKLIVLREHKEKLLKKEEAAAKELRLKQSNGNSSVPNSEDDTFISRQDGEYDEEQDAPVIDESNIYFNYQTYMDKTSIKRWSKQDTEKFYEAMRQFGTDFSLIQQVFPDCDRRQLKLKFKKEEKKNPLMLREVLTNSGSCGENSLFTTVIERLKQIAAEEKLKADKEEEDYLTGDEEVEEVEGTSNVDNESGKKEEKFEEEVSDNVGRNEFVEEGESPAAEAYASEEDSYKWSPYRSDF